jgi:hypothetical protein
MNPYSTGLLGLAYSNGYNPNVQYSTPIKDPNNQYIFVGFKMYSSIINNFNLSLVLIFVCLLCGIVLKFIVKRCIKDQQLNEKIEEISSDVIGSLTFYLLNFSAYLMAVSISINLKTGSSSMMGYAIIGLCLVLVVGYTIFLIKFF